MSLKKRNQIITIIIILFFLSLAAVGYLYFDRIIESFARLTELPDQRTPAVRAEEPVSYDLTFDAQGGETSPSAIRFSPGSGPKTLPIPKRADYRFTGWYYQPDENSPAGISTSENVENPKSAGYEKMLIASDIKLTKSTVLYAHWERKPFGIDQTTAPVPVLMYHNLYDPEYENKDGDGNWMSAVNFEQQMAYLSENNYYFPTWDELYEYVMGNTLLPEKSIVITMDDGYENFFRLAAPILQRYEVRATSFVITSQKHISAVYLDRYRSDLIQFESHSHDMHRSGYDGKGAITTWEQNKVFEDLTKSVEIVGSKEAFSYPLGHHNAHAEEMLRRFGFKVAVTTEYGKVRPGMDPMKLPRVRMSAGITLNGFINAVK